MRNSAPLRELHVALVGMGGSGKSAVAVKYLTKRFIGEYDSTLEDTYCRQETVGGQCMMVWMMDTVESAERDEMRWIAWADVYVVLYDVTSQLSFQYAEGLLERISRHEHVLCAREHRTILVGNKSDLERYRQVSENEGERLASQHKAYFAECSAANDLRQFTQTLQSTFQNIISGARSPSPRNCSSDSEIITPRKGAFSSLRSSSRSSQVRSKTSTTKTPSQVQPLHKTPSLSKLKTGNLNNSMDRLMKTSANRMIKSSISFEKTSTMTSDDANDGDEYLILKPDVESEVEAARELLKIGIQPVDKYCRLEPLPPAHFPVKKLMRKKSFGN